MIYNELKGSQDISATITILKKEFRNLAQLTFPSSYEATMGQKKVLTIFRNLKPEMKIEGPEDLLDIFKEVLEEEKQKYYSKN